MALLVLWTMSLIKIAASCSYFISLHSFHSFALGVIVRPKGLTQCASKLAYRLYRSLKQHSWRSLCTTVSKLTYNNKVFAPTFGWMCSLSLLHYVQSLVYRQAWACLVRVCLPSLSLRIHSLNVLDIVCYIQEAYRSFTQTYFMLGHDSTPVPNKVYLPSLIWSVQRPSLAQNSFTSFIHPNILAPSLRSVAHFFSSSIYSMQQHATSCHNYYNID